MNAYFPINHFNKNRKLIMQALKLIPTTISKSFHASMCYFFSDSYSVTIQPKSKPRNYVQHDACYYVLLLAFGNNQLDLGIKCDNSHF